MVAFQSFHTGLGEATEDETNYLGMNKKNIDDLSYALIIDDMDTDFLVLDTGNDVLLCSGDVTDNWDLYYTGSTNRACMGLGEHEYGWYLLTLTMTISRGQ